MNVPGAHSLTVPSIGEKPKVIGQPLHLCILILLKREVSAAPGHIPVGEPAYRAVLGRTKQVQTIRHRGASLCPWH